MYNHDKIIDSLFFINDKYNLSNVTKVKRNKKYQNILYYLTNRFYDSESIRETLYRIHYKIFDKPKCKVCGCDLHFRGKSNVFYPQYCSNKCKGADIEFHKLIYETSVKRYGVNNSTNHKKYIETCNKKYGVDNSFQIPHIIEIIKEKNKEKNYGLDKQIETVKLKYGKDYYLQTDEFKEKSKITSFEKYGVSHPMKSEDIKKKLNYLEISQKGISTKYKNNTFNKSKPEDNSYTLIKNKYNDVIRQYKSKEYPFSCDFYIPSIDTYIECNYFWTHGKHPFDEHNSKDIDTINNWRYHNTEFYDNAIKTWTVRDVKKRYTAKQNKLNFIEFWNIDELIEWLQYR